MLSRSPLWDRGKTKFDWWPDWRGQAVAIVASGPSAKKTNVDGLRGRLPVLAIKECAVDLCPWADVVYGCDGAWWKHRRGLPDRRGVKIVWEKDIPSQFPGVHAITIKETKNSRPNDRRYVNEIMMDEPGVIGSGHNSGFQALNLSIQFGAVRIVLVGFDMRGEHYYGRNNWFKAGNPDQYQFERCIRAFNDNAPILKSLGVDVVNVSDRSELKCFRKSSIEQVLQDWSL